MLSKEGKIRNKIFYVYPEIYRISWDIPRIRK